MAIRSFQSVAEEFSVVADVNRLGLLALIAQGHRYPGEMAGKSGLTPTAVSHHLAILRLSGIVDAKREGANNRYEIVEGRRRFVDAVLALAEKQGKGGA